MLNKLVQIIIISWTVIIGTWLDRIFAVEIPKQFKHKQQNKFFFNAQHVFQVIYMRRNKKIDERWERESLVLLKMVTETHVEG